MENLNHNTQTPTAEVAQSSNPNNSTFPVEVFPDPIKDYILAHETYKGMARDHMGLATLMATSSAVGNTHNIKGVGIVVAPVLFGVLVGPSGTAKSGVAAAAYKQIIDLQKILVGENKKEMRTYKLELQRWKAFKKVYLSNGIPEPVAPALEKVYLDKVTTASIAKSLPNSRRSMTLFKDEIAEFLDQLNKEKDDFLSFWNNEQYTRETARDEVFVESPFVNLFGTTQPSRLNVLAKNQGVGSGLSARFLFGYSEARIRGRSGEIDKRIIEDNDYVQSKLLNLKMSVGYHGNPVPTVLTFDQAALERYESWRMEYFDFDEDLDETEITIKVKLENYSLRFALILELMYWAAHEGGEKITTVGIRAVEGAIKLTEYFLESSLKAHEYIMAGISQVNSKDAKDAKIIEMVNNDKRNNEIKSVLNVSEQRIVNVKEKYRHLLNEIALKNSRSSRVIGF